MRRMSTGRPPIGSGVFASTMQDGLSDADIVNAEYYAKTLRKSIYSYVIGPYKVGWWKATYVKGSVVAGPINKEGMGVLHVIGPGPVTQRVIEVFQLLMGVY